jgi:hypothetical protein
MWIGVEANTGKRLLVRNTNNGKNIIKTLVNQ